MLYNQTHAIIDSKSFKHGINIDVRTRFSGNSRGDLIKVDSNEAVLYKVTTDKVTFVKRLGNPCGEEETCQPFMGEEFFSITGIWGTYVGNQNETRRLRVANAANGKSGVGIAVNDVGEYLYIGSDDADIGLLKDVEMKSRDGDEVRYRPIQVDVLPSTKDSARWYIDYLGIPKTIRLLQNLTLAPVKVAILDSGVLPTHSNLTLHHSLDIPNTLDDDNNGFVDDYLGYDFVRESGSLKDGFGHGTHVTGLANTSPNAQIFTIRALDSNGKSNSVDLLRGLEYAIVVDADVINCSWGGGSVTQALVNGFEKVRRKGIVVFSSAGNDGGSNDAPNIPEVPKCFKGVIGVGAVDSNGGLPKYSNYGGKSVMFLAPGDKILSATKDGVRVGFITRDLGRKVGRVWPVH